MSKIDKSYQASRKAIHAGYKKLFPLSMLTVAVIGMAEYKRRTLRYEEFCRRVLNRQRAATGRAIDSAH